MAAKPNIKFMGRSGGVVHVVTTKREDLKHSKCPSLKKGHENDGWKGKGLSPEAALDLKGCARCDTHVVAEAERKARMTPAQKRAESKANARDTMDKFNVDKNKAAAKKAKKVKDPGERKRRGPKQGDATERMKANVEEHAAIAGKVGWTTKAWESGTNEWTCEAVRSGETLKLIYRDGRTVWARVVLASGVEVRLRNSSNWRKHAEGKSGIKKDYAPRQNVGKKANKTHTLDDHAPRNLPFNLESDDHDTIIESMVGKTITWRRSIDNKLDTATLPQRTRNCRMQVHPKSGRAMISFHEHQGANEHGEMLGGERTVYLDKILKAR